MRFKKLDRFPDVKINYVTYNKYNGQVRYKIFNNQVIVDLKSIIDGILEEQGIGGYKTDKVELSIPFDIDKEVTGNSLAFIVDKRRYILRLKNMEVIPSNQQKIDYDNTHPHRWGINQWIKYIESLFFETYGMSTIELDLRGTEGKFRRGKAYHIVKALIKKILDITEFKADHYSVIEYLKWIFSFKKKHPISIGSLQSDYYIQEWIFYKKREKGKPGNGNIKRKWDD